MNLLIRADADSTIGTGHVMRGLALAQAAQDAGGQATFLTAHRASALEERLQSENFRVCHLAAQPGGADDALETISLAREISASWIVVDGYLFDFAYQHNIKSSGLPLLFIDDHGHAQKYCADFVLNQNIYAHQDFYCNRDPQTQLLLGVHYALLRREFLKRRGKRPADAQSPRKMLVTLGGSDERNLTSMVLEAVKKLPASQIEATVVVGPANQHLEMLQHEARHSSNINIMPAVGDMSALMAWADIAISSAGVTCYELVFMKVPTLAIVLADNQVPVAEGLSKAGAVISLGSYETLQADDITNALNRLLEGDEERSRMVSHTRGLIDGNGARRVLTRLNGHGLRLRPARLADCRMVWEWSNSTEVREASFSSADIPFETHKVWYQEKLASPDCLLYIALNSHDVPVGQLRFEFVGNKWVVSIVVASKFRGHGIGSTIIRLGCRELFRSATATRVHAYIKSENGSSLGAFSRAGFRTIGETQVRSHPAVEMKLERDYAEAQ